MRYLSTQAFLRNLNKNKKYCFILGSGASVSSGIPSGYSLAKRWLQEMKNNKSVLEYASDIERRIQVIADGRTDYSRFKNPDYEPDLENSLDDYSRICELRFEKDSEKEWKYLYQIMTGKTPICGYWPLADILTKTASNVVITTNFDELTEKAIEYYTDSRYVCLSHEKLGEIIIIEQFPDRPKIIKLHRDILTKPFNTGDTLESLQPEWISILNEILQSYTPIVIGYAGTDNTLTKYLLEHENKNGIYWCHMYGSLPNSSVNEIVEKSNGSLVEIWSFDHIMHNIADILCNNPIYGKEIIGSGAGLINFQGYSGYYFKGILSASKRKHMDKTIINKYKEANKTSINPISINAMLMAYVAGKLRMRGFRKTALHLYEAAFSHEMKNNRYYGKARYFHAKTMVELCNLEAAETEYRQLLDPSIEFSDKGVMYIRNEIALHLFNVLLREGKVSDAQKEIEQYLKIRKCDGLIHREHAVALYMTSEFSAALNSINKAIECHGQDGEQGYMIRDYLIRGIIYYSMEHYDNAREDFSLVVSTGIDDYTIGRAALFLTHMDDDISEADICEVLLR